MRIFRIIIYCLIFLLGASPHLYGQDRYLDSLLKLVKTDREDSNKVIHLNKIADAYQEKGEYDTGIEYSKLAEKLAIQLKYNEGLAGAYNELGIAYRNFGDYPKALEWLFKALKIREGSWNKNGLGRIYGNIGIIYRLEGDHEKALEYYFKALQISVQTRNLREKGISLGNIAIIYNDMGLYDKSLVYYFKALDISKEVGDQAGVSRQTGNIGTVYQEMAEKAEAKGDHVTRDSLYKKAIAYEQTSLNIDRELHDKIGMVIWLGNLGGIYLQMKKYVEAGRYLKRSLFLADSIHDLYGSMDANDYLSRLYQETGNYKMALASYKMAIRQQDSLFSEESAKDITRKEMTYTFEKKEEASRLDAEKKEAIALADKKKQKIILFSVLGISIFVLGFAVFAYRSFLQKRKANLEITSQKAEIEEKQKEILDSIFYARRIQRSLLPTEKYMLRVLAKLNKIS